MSVYNFRPAVAANLGLFIGLAGGTASGKTWSAMEMAAGIVGPGKRFAVIDTESRRASHYAKHFDFDVLDLDAPYSSERYRESVEAAYKAGYGAIVLDNATHEHDNVGGYLDLQAHDLDERVERALKKNPGATDWQVREKLTPSSWIAPKRARNRMMQALLACSSTVPIIFCFRAEEKVFATKDGKLVAQNPPVWQPICGKGMPFEMTVFFLLHRERPGVPVPIKLTKDHKALFPLDKPLDRETGRRIAEWARGGTVQGAAPSSSAGAAAPASATDSGPAYINADQVTVLGDMLKENGLDKEAFLRAIKVPSLQHILAEKYAKAKAIIEETIEKRKAA